MRRTLIVGLGMAMTLLVGLVIYWLMIACDLDRDYAKLSVMKHLEKYKLDPKYLEEDRSNDGACTLAYVYKNDIETMHFKVVEGYKVKWFHVKEEPRE